MLKSFLEPCKEIKKIMWGENYKQLLNILKLIFLPMALENAEVSTTISVNNQIENKEFKVLIDKKAYNSNGCYDRRYNKEIYKHIKELYKLKEQ
ncbi:hypothetical protein [Abyssisolibacter fermentans]|uniref:hypothetical protein n=1 Tax=Abyssisolibacter fermentans TaxID=1766203 RepID=UPI0012E34E2A|nr:hypothetical protein [Abyssisolibacter fermentans]